MRRRKWMLRKADQAVAAVEKCTDYLLELRSIYDPDYPEHVEALDRLLSSCVALIDVLKLFREQI